ncbi:MAG TPA: preprotein translocase subunit SecA [SAR86 cluster bacterium]|jgi:preprotein translocase subunit SecA|nr:preprotein translocase subunit SecA [SAR86 cluster bacterium]
MGVLDKIFGSKNQKILKKVQPLVRAINGLEEDYSRLQDEDLKNKRNEFIKRHSEGESLDELLPEAFAVVREVSKRQLGLRHYDCQLVGGVALHNCQIAEMATGEGKTLVATLPSYLNSLTERKVVLVTVNDYLAKRDAEWMRPIYENLGIGVSFITSGQDLNERKGAYEADVIYATNNELGFDFLRNNMVVNTEDRVMNDYYFAIIDEVDSILIDEARTPLVISGPTENTADIYQKISKFIPKLTQQISDEDEEGESKTIKEGHFIIEEKSKQIELTDSGHDHIEGLLKESNMLQQDQSLYSSGNLRMLHFIQSSLRAHFLFKKDVDYMVQENQVVLIDENTGRAMPGRRLADGLHQAIEQKENVPIQMESQTLASCTFQNFFRQFEKLSGMTGTASTEAEEFAEIYGLNVVEIPTNEKMIRDDQNDKVYLTEKEKYKAVVKEIEAYKEKGNPVLVGTASLESSEMLSGLLNQINIDHQVLNAKNHAKEAQIISQAGKPGVITIATNMAGRGTDIVLGGNWEAEFEKLGNEDESKKKELKANWKNLNEKVLSAGGLHVIGTERNESRRMDNQLRGRSGRQGDPGSSSFYISLEDSLMRIFASDQFKNIMQRVGLEDGEAIEHRMLSGAIERAQKRVEGRNFDIRKLLLEYDDMANEQRQIIYSQRNSILESDVITDLVESMRETVIADEIESAAQGDLDPHEWDIDPLEASIFNIFGFQIPIKEWVKETPNITTEEVQDRLVSIAIDAYKNKSQSIGPVMKDFEKQILLQIIDASWKDHLAEVDALRQGIGLRSYGAKNPKLEFRRESFELFESLLDKIRLEGIRFLSRVEIELEDSGELNLPKQDQKQTLDHQNPQSALAVPKQESNPENNQEQASGNRRLRRAEAKLARKNAKKK